MRPVAQLDSNCDKTVGEEAAAKIEAERQEAIRLEHIRAEQEAKAEAEQAERERINAISLACAEASAAVRNTTTEGEPAMPAGAGPELARPAANEPAIDDDSAATIKLGEICNRLGFTVTADFLASLGHSPVGHEKNAKLYLERDFAPICRSISGHVLGAASNHHAAKIAA